MMNKKTRLLMRMKKRLKMTMKKKLLKIIMTKAKNRRKMG
jgi:hypothetical protein